MKNTTRNEKFQVATSIGEERRWAWCFGDFNHDGHDFSNGYKKTFYHGKEVTVCKHCYNAIKTDVPTLGKPTANGLTYIVTITTTTDIGKAYLFVNGYSHISKNQWQLCFNRFNAPRKTIDELTKTTAYGHASVNIKILDKNGDLVKEFKGVKDADVVSDFVKTI